MKEITILTIAWLSVFYSVWISIKELIPLLKAIKKKKWYVYDCPKHTREHAGILISMIIFVLTWVIMRTLVETEDPWVNCVLLLIFFNILYSTFMIHHLKEERLWHLEHKCDDEI